ncbi:hypothetical protein, partial [Streptococcus thermophilus]|uniref:hypothetical protein n=1 Tax=Streptococcus thermophilus TaxID=1308 RepID=UPI0021A76A5B
MLQRGNNILRYQSLYEFSRQETSTSKVLFLVVLALAPLLYGSIISVVGKTTVEIIELFECTQKVP